MEEIHAGCGGQRRPFTDFLRCLERGEEPDSEALDAILKRLRRPLRRTLQQRGLWQLPPSYVGVVGWSSWQAPGSGGRRADDALQELSLDALQYICHRLPALMAQSRVKENVEGLFVRNVHNFIHERQQRHDRLGTRVFRIVSGAIERAIRAGELAALAGDGRLRSSSLLAFVAPTDAPAVAARETIDGFASTWCGRLLPALVTTTGRGIDRLLVDVWDAIRELETAGVQAFRFGDLVGAISRELRGRWSAVFAASSSHAAAPGTPAAPERRDFETRQHFEDLAACVEQNIASERQDEESRQRLETVWQLLVRWADDRADPGDLPLVSQAHAPSRRAVAKLLGISRDRVGAAYEMLGSFVRRCRARLASRRGAVRDGQLPHWAPASAMKPIDDIKERLLRRILESSAGARLEHEAMAREGRKAGDIFVARDTDSVCEWVALEIEPSSGAILAVPADTLSIAGRHDLVLSRFELGGPLTLRCALARRLQLARLATAPSRRVAKECVEAARRAWQRAEAESSSGEPLTDLDLDPEYRAWMARVEAEADSLAEPPAPLP